MARDQLVFSRQAVDAEGNEKGGSEFYRKLWNPEASQRQLVRVARVATLVLGVSAGHGALAAPAAKRWSRR